MCVREYGRHSFLDLEGEEGERHTDRCATRGGKRSREGTVAAAAAGGQTIAGGECHYVYGPRGVRLAPSRRGRPITFVHSLFVQSRSFIRCSAPEEALDRGVCRRGSCTRTVADFGGERREDSVE